MDGPQTEQLLSYLKILEDTLANIFQICIISLVWPRLQFK